MTASQVRRLIASAASFAVAVMLWKIAHPEHAPGTEWILLGAVVAVPAVAAALVWVRRLEAQLLARATWWSLMLAGALAATVVGGYAARPGCALVAGNAIALLASGSTGLDAGGGRFQPVAFRGTLLLALVLAIADTGALLWCGLANFLFDGRARALLLVPLLATGVVGLLRLRTWGLLVSIASNLLVAILALTGVLGLPPELRALFATTATLQLLVPIPMLIAIARRRPPGPDRWPRARRVARDAAIVAVVAVSVYATYILDHALFHLSGV
jgi:hypothetical protein